MHGREGKPRLIAVKPHRSGGLAAGALFNMIINTTKCNNELISAKRFYEKYFQIYFAVGI
jgi:hypothetical protein